MDEQPQVAATKLFGRPAETCEEKIQSHLRSLRKVLAEFLDWRTSEEKRHRDYLETSEAERRRIEAEFERLHRFLAEKERAVLGRLAELEAAFEAAQAEKSLRVAEGITRLHGLIGQLEVKRTPQVRPLLTEKLPKSAAHGVLTPLFPLILGYREHPKQLERNEASPPLGAPRRAGEEPELLPPPTGCSLGGPEGIQRCLGRNSVLLGGIQGYFWRIWRCLGRNTLLLGGIQGYFGRIPRHFGRKRGLFKGRPQQTQHHAHLLPLLPDTVQPQTKPGRGRCPSREEKAKLPREPGAVPLPQLLADRKSARWDEEERDKAEEPRRGQGPASGSERVTPGRCRTRTC
ncbi:uncharacterized protein ACIBXB_005526 isoform 3-T3 [Morphnus guianensis]